MGITTENIDFELIERGVVQILFAGLNDAIDAQNTKWGALDSAYYTALDRTTPTITVEHIAPENFYAGHVPSLIDAGIDRYPNISVLCSQADSLNSNDDHQEQYAIRMAVEIMCKAECSSDRPDQTQDALAAELVNSRVKRTVEAVRSCLTSEAARSFGQIVPRVGGTPNLIVTDVFVRKEEKGRGPRWFWCGARLDYRIVQWVNYHASSS